MKIKISIIIILLLVGLVGTASADRVINGTQYFTTWDGRLLDPELSNCPLNDCVYQTTQNGTDLFLNDGQNNIIALPYDRDGWTYDFDFRKISPKLTFPKSQLVSKYINHNITVAYLKFPYSVSRMPDFIDEHNIRVGGWSWDNAITIYDDNVTKNYLNQSSYDLKTVNNEIRLYFLKSEANKLQGNITFEMNSWTINGSTTPAWQNTSFDNTTQNGADENNIVIGNGADWFNRVNNTDLGSSWTEYGTTTTITNNRFVLAATGYNNGAIYNQNNNSGNNVSFTWYDINTTTAQTLNVLIRMQNTSILGNGYVVIFIDNSTASPGLRWWNGTLGSNIDPVAGGGTAMTIVSGTVITFNINSTAVNIWYDGAFRGALDFINVIPYNNGYIGFVRGYLQDFDDFRIWNTTSGNLTTWYDYGSGNETYQIDVNATTSENTNYTVWYGNNASGTWTQLGDTLTGNNSLTISGTKYQNTDLKVILNGNTTATPELIQITFFDQATGEGETIEPIIEFIDGFVI